MAAPKANTAWSPWPRAGAADEVGRGRDEQQPARDEPGDGGDLQDHQHGLHAAAHGHAQAVDDGEREQRGHAERRLRQRDAEQAAACSARR